MIQLYMQDQKGQQVYVRNEIKSLNHRRTKAKNNKFRLMDTREITELINVSISSFFDF